MKTNSLPILILILPQLLSVAHAAAKKKPQIQIPTGAKLISNQAFDSSVRSGSLKMIPSLPSSSSHSTPLARGLEAVKAIQEDFESRLPDKKKLIKPELQGEIQISVPLEKSETQTIKLLGAEFAASTLSQNLQVRTSSFNENLIASQVVRMQTVAPTPDSQDKNTPGSPGCDREVGYLHGLDLGTDVSTSYSPTGLISQFSWPLKPYLTCVKDQGKRGSCTAFATASAIETLIASQTHVWINLSEQAIYNQSKLFWSPEYSPTLPATPNEQSDGYVTSSILNNAKKYSYVFPLETDWEYNSSLKIISESSANSTKWLITHACDGYTLPCSNTVHQGQLVCSQYSPTLRCGYLTAAPESKRGAKLKDYIELWNHSDVSGSLELAVAYLNSGQPLIASLAINQRFLSLRDGFADAPEVNPEPTHPDEILGYHAITLVGYLSRPAILRILPNAPLNSLKAKPEDPISGYFIAKNQWGTRWGDGGYVYLPGDYLANNLLALQALAGIDLVGINTQ